ncbi:hypothetical protein BKA70DRAFT_1402842 [Coprinopsis sp. MPI-PUGE-AT-0042]|nr:hypothetical protein BKA70DRAFT_1402842 [Coprinopsis sp. MPI-PUGE-AT-0042]
MSTVGVNINIVNMRYPSSFADPLHFSYLPPLPMCSTYDAQDAYHISPVSTSSGAVLSPLTSPSSSASTPPTLPSPPPSQSRKRKPKKIRTTIPRPPNAFILFRSDFWAREKQKLNPIERNHRDISRIVGYCWRNLDAISRQYYYDHAFQLRETHRQKHPDYKFKPAVKKSRVDRKELPSEKDARCAHLASTLMPELLSKTWVQDATQSYAIASEALQEAFILQPTLDLLWDDPFGLFMTDIEFIDMAHGALGDGIQEQSHMWGVNEAPSTYRPNSLGAHGVPHPPVFIGTPIQA